MQSAAVRTMSTSAIQSCSVVAAKRTHLPHLWSNFTVLKVRDSLLSIWERVLCEVFNNFEVLKLGPSPNPSRLNPDLSRRDLVAIILKPVRIFDVIIDQFLQWIVAELHADERNMYKICKNRWLRHKQRDVY